MRGASTGEWPGACACGHLVRTEGYAACSDTRSRGARGWTLVRAWLVGRYFELDTQLVAEANAKLNAVSVSLGADFVHSLDAYREHERSPHGWQSKHAGGMWWQGGLPRAPRYEVCYVGPLARKGGAQLAASAGYPAYESIGACAARSLWLEDPSAAPVRPRGSGARECMLRSLTP